MKSLAWRRRLSAGKSIPGLLLLSPTLLAQVAPESVAPVAAQDTLPSTEAPAPEAPKASGEREARDEATPAEPEPTEPEAEVESLPSEPVADAQDSEAQDTPPKSDRPAAPDTGSALEESTAGAESAPEMDAEWDAGLDHTGTPAGPPDEEEPSSDAGEGERQKDLDGRKEKLTADQVLIWIPRSLLYPVHLTLNYVVRWPVVKALEKAEEHHIPKKVENFFTFADGDAGLYPVAFYDAGRGFWGGLNFFWNDLGREGHNIAATGGYGTSGWIGLNIRDKWDVFEDASGEFSWGASFIRDPNNAYTGVGPDTSHEDLVFFQEEKLEGYMRLQTKLRGLSRFTTAFHFKNSRLGDGRPPGIESADSTFDTDGLTGFDSHFWLLTAKMGLDLDTRFPKVRDTPGSGARLETWINYNGGPGETHLSFFKYGAFPKAIWDITGSNHVLQFGIYAEALSKTGGEDVPVSELVALGGDHLKGFLRGRFRGESAYLYDLEYDWPLLGFADAFIFTEVGNAYSGFFEDFSHRNMVFNWGTGLKTSISQDFGFFLALGFGSNQFDQMDTDGFQVDKVRFYAGATRGF